MTTLTSHRHTTHHVHLPREAPRKVAAALVVAVGAVLLVMTFANNLFKVGPSFENLMDGFRPHLTSEAIATARADLTGLGAAGTEMQSTMLPAMAQQLGMTPTEFSAYLAQSYPEVSAGIQALPQIVTTFDGLVTTLDDQRPLFRSADAIPTDNLPATTVPWTIAVAGGVLVLSGLVLWTRPRLGATVAVVLGAVLLVASVTLSLPQKAGDSDDLNANLKPVYTAALVTQAQGALATVSAMGTQLQTEMLPALAAQLKMTPAQLQQFLGQSFPATAAALANLPAAMPRFQGLAGTFEDNLGNYNTLKPVSFAPIIWTMMGVGLLATAFGAAVLLWPRHEVVALSVR
jgi:hypothetical protein